MKDEKLQKALARMGLGSRRQMEEVIKAAMYLLIMVQRPLAIASSKAMRYVLMVVRLNIRPKMKNVAACWPIISLKAKCAQPRILKAVQPFLSVYQN